MTTRYKHIFFDFDRTLWDFDAAAEATFEQLVEIYNLKEQGIPSAHEFYNVYHPLNEELWVLYRANMITKEELSRTRFIKPLLHFGINDIKLAEKLSHDYVTISPHTVRLIDGTHEILDYLNKRYLLHIITNGFGEVQKTKLQEANIEQYFTTLTISEEIGIKKPSPEIFLYAMNKAGATAQESIMIGDEIAVDIEGARSVGMDQIFFNPKGYVSDGKSTFEVRQLIDIEDIL